MGDGASKFGCYCMQRDEEVENAVAVFSAQQLHNNEHTSCLPIGGGRRKRAVSFGGASSPSRQASKQAPKKVQSGPPPPPPREPSDTVIIFDWDDTLLCSSAINAQRYTEPQLKTLEKAVEGALTLAMSLGETIVVTNGNRTWVEESSERYLPGVVPLLRQLRVVSARAQYENAFPQDPFAWKRMAFREIMAGRPSTAAGPAGVNLVVIGDSVVEIEAAKSANKVLTESSVVKTLKLKEAPGVHELVGELRKLVLELDKLVKHDHKANRMLVPRILPAHLDHLHSWAAGWQLSDGRSHLRHPVPMMLHF